MEDPSLMVSVLMNVCLCHSLFQNNHCPPTPAYSPHNLDLTGLAPGLYTLHVKAILDGEVIQEFDLSYVNFKFSGRGE